VEQGLRYLREYERIWEISEDSSIEENYPCLRSYIDSVLLGKKYSVVFL
jgi:hypothetical protein